MKKLKFWLTGLLLVQLLLAVALLLNNQWEAQKNKPKPLLAIDWQSVDQLMVETKDFGVTLLKSDASWILSDTKLPINNDDINELLRSLKNLQTGWPVATMSSSHKRFEVADDKFLRHVEVYSQGDLLGELFFGNSPGLRQSHVRRAGDDAIYNVRLDTLDINANADLWIDKGLISASDISAIRGPDYNVKRTGATWFFNRSGPSIFLGNSNQGKLDQNKVDELSAALSNLEIYKIARYKPVLTSDDTVKTTLEVTDDKGSWTYLFVKVGDAYFVQRNDREEMFTLKKAVYEKIADLRQTDLIMAKPE